MVPNLAGSTQRIYTLEESNLLAFILFTPKHARMKETLRASLILLAILSTVVCTALQLERSGADTAVAEDVSRYSLSKTDENVSLRESVHDHSSADGHVSAPPRSI